MAFDQAKAPRIPSAPRDYDEKYFNQLARALDNFFGIFNSNAGQHMDSMSTASLKTPFKALTVVTGINDDLKVPGYTFLRVVDPGANFGIGGFITREAVYNTSSTLVSAAVDGQQLIVFNPSSRNMTIHNEQTTTTAAARIITGTGANINMSTGVASFIYSVTDARWALISHQG